MRRPETRGAPYRHFPHKESLLVAIGTRAWDRLCDLMQELRAGADWSDVEKLRSGVIALIDIGRSRPHLYKLIFSNPSGDPTALARAVERSQTEFLAIVADLVGEQDARRYAALLISIANGAAGVEVSGQLPNEK